MSASHGRSRTRLLLVGAGHAHLEVLRRIAIERPAGLDLSLVTPEPRQVYSGMVPGYLAGTYRLDEISVPVAPLVERAGGRVIAGRAEAVNPARRIVGLAGGEEVPYDLVSFAVGSNTAGIERPEIAAGAVPVKPLVRVIELHERLRTLAARPLVERRAAVVGGGAAGFEVALALRSALGPEAAITLVERGPEILASSAERLRRCALAALARRRIAVETGAAVARVDRERALLEDGREIPSSLTVWLAGAVGWPLFRGAGLPLDPRGFLLIDGALRSIADSRIFAAGDCGTLAEFPDTPKAGVYAVREAPILWQSLRAALAGTPPPSYRPQTGYLSLLNLGDGRALLDWKGLVVEGRLPFSLKNWIDRRFLAKYA